MTRIETWAGRLMAGRAGLPLALILTLALALPGFFSLPPIDRDEVLFAQSSRQMLQSGDYVDIRFADAPRYKKPVGIYWLQAAAAALTGVPDAIWSYRLVSLAAALAAVGLTWTIARRVLRPEAAVLAAVILGAGLVFGGEARLAKTDMTQAALILLGQAVIARMWLPGGREQAPNLGRGAVLAFWLALSGAILVKGPVGPMVLGFTLAGLSLIRRDLGLIRALRPLWGLALTVLLVAPWFIAITWKSDGAFWAASVGHDLMGKLVEGQESHGAPPGSYLLAVWGTFWPGSMLLLAALPGLWALRRTPLMALALVWVVPAWVVFELTPTKLIHYPLPLYPALAILVAAAVERERLWRGAAWVLAPLPLLLAVALGVLAHRAGLGLPWAFWTLIALSALVAALVPLALRRGSLPALTGAVALAGLGLAVAVYPVLARIDGLWPARSIAALAAAHPECPLTVAGYAEPSLVFWTGNRATLATPDEAVQALSGPGCRLVVLPAAQAPGEGIARITGLELGSGRRLDLVAILTGT